MLPDFPELPELPELPEFPGTVEIPPGGVVVELPEGVVVELPEVPFEPELLDPPLPGCEVESNNKYTYHLPFCNSHKITKGLLAAPSANKFDHWVANERVGDGKPKLGLLFDLQFGLTFGKSFDFVQKVPVSAISA